MASERRRKRSSAPSISSLMVDAERVSSDLSLLGSMLCVFFIPLTLFVQWTDRKDMWPVKNWPIVPNDFLTEMLLASESQRKENRSVSVQFWNLVFARSYSRRPSRARLVTQVSSAEIDYLQFSTEAVKRQFGVADRGRKPVPDDWSIDSKTSSA